LGSICTLTREMLFTARILLKIPAALHLIVQFAVTPTVAKLKESNLPEPVLKSEYAVRGEIALRAQEIQAELDAAKKNRYDPDEVCFRQVGTMQHRQPASRWAVTADLPSPDVVYRNHEPKGPEG